MNIASNIQKLWVFLMLCSVFSCDRTDWNENFKESSKSPFGTYIVYEEAEALFDSEVLSLDQNIYDYLFEEMHEDHFGNYICIKSDAEKLNTDGINYLLTYIERGNHALLSLNNFPPHLKDTLGITTTNLDFYEYTPVALKALDGRLQLKDEAFNTQTYTYDRNIRRHYFETYNSNTSVVLGTVEVDGEQKPNFLKIYYGEGTILLHATPIVFTNFNLLNGREAYAAHVLSYLPDNPIVWDPQIKSSQYSETPEKPQDSMFVFFLKHPSLTWFLMVSLFGLLLFMLFNARRKQRAIPIIKPLENSTVAFAQTISNLYLKEADHKNLVDKKITYFLEKVREQYLINTSNLNREFIETLALKSNNDFTSTKYLINTIIALNKKTECTDVELLVLNNMIDKFFKT
ncbi:DUF4350 domain-containing protein [Formosa algae]|uniref:DUF4350 domain-containing protein n=2 Tax=Formosa algae TaxID=225843 RepID=A0A9X0YRJ1_9FLAO|nr:hypothetical protein [Formosa algae]MDQ0337126.1 hypothetical protein [Formosa algae]